MESNHINIAKLLIPHSDPTNRYSKCLTTAARMDNLQMLKILLPHSDASANGAEALDYAMKNKNFEMINVLLDNITNETVLGEALLKSTKSFDASMTRVLIDKMSDANYRDSLALTNMVTTIIRVHDSYFQSALSIVDLLFDKSEIDKVKEHCYSPDLPVTKYFLEKYESLKTKEELNKHIGNCGNSIGKKRII